MTGPLAFDSGEFLPADRLSIPIYDTGFILGVTISEQLRTFGGKLFALDRHLDRLGRSLEIIGLHPGMSLEQIGDAAIELVANNHALLAKGDDLGCTILVSPGANASLAPPGEDRPRVRIHTQPLAFSSWHRCYDQGVALANVNIRQTPANCWPVELKCRSRMHYYLADREAQSIDPPARAVITDQKGFVLEASTANLVLFNEGEGFVSPPLDQILVGVSLNTVDQLSGRLAIPFRHRRFTPQDLRKATEVMLCSTSPCVWPVSRLDRQPIGRLGEDTVAQRLLRAWSELVGLDIAKQAAEFAHRPTAVR